MTDIYHLGGCQPLAAAMYARLDAAAVPARLNGGDYTLWSDRPDEISDRLGWLTLPADMLAPAAELQRFGKAARQAGCRYVVVLGMGGSSLGPDVIARTVGAAPPDNADAAGNANADGTGARLLALDSTLPQWVTNTTNDIDPAHTVFIVSSKSGSTTESSAFYTHFRSLLDASAGKTAAGDHFIAITDAGTALDDLAQADGFRRAFLNDPNIGGRYSALSHFGLVPAALAGVDLPRLLAPALRMQQRCLVAGPVKDNPGARLGAVIGALAQSGRDKLTLLTTPRATGLGMWVEQLLAESAGKSGVGVVPVVNEPPLPPDRYGNDRLFVHLRLDDDDNAAADAAVAALCNAGQPVIRLSLPDAYAVGAEFYRWEYAIAVAGHILGIHPFDQPDVQSAKDRTLAVLTDYQRDGQLPRARSDGFSRLRNLLDNGGAGDYLAIMAYLTDTPAIDAAVQDLRQRVGAAYGIATTAGYGPRYLHSTGQLHKGGPASGIYLQLTQQHAADLDIPGWPFSFGVLADAQALGDLQALDELGRRTVSLRLEGDAAAAIRRLAASL